MFNFLYKGNEGEVLMLLCSAIEIFKEVWFIIQWENKTNSFSPVPQTLIVGNKDPAVGDKVVVQEKGKRKK